MKTLTTIIFLFLVIALVVLIGRAEVLGKDPTTTNVDGETAFVFPSPISDAYILALPEGAFEISGEHVGGCYELKTIPGSDIGTAEWIWPFCLKGGKS